MQDQFDIPLQEIAVPRPTYRDRVAAAVAGTVRDKAEAPRMKLARRAYLAAQTFPNDRFVRQPRREEQPLPEFTPERNRKMLALAYSNGPQAMFMPRKPSRREAIIRRRIAEKDLRKTIVADHPLGQRAGGQGEVETRYVLGKRCRIASSHLVQNASVNGMRSEIAQDLSPNAVAERKSRGLTALGTSASSRTGA